MVFRGGDHPQAAAEGGSGGGEGKALPIVVTFQREEGEEEEEDYLSSLACSGAVKCTKEENPRARV